MDDKKIINEVLKDFPLKPIGLFQAQILDKIERAIRKALVLKERQLNLKNQR
ncbi:hypothetical protein LCGC14_2879550 [marine sediment metagenome]|uniref:Uncharacterized protein n=1 Tax=marine sediment metagenome TaxID=412755 RepID=A0A0F8Y0I5_9ZZZZ